MTIPPSPPAPVPSPPTLERTGQPNPAWQWLVPTLYIALTVAALWWALSGVELTSAILANGFMQLRFILKEMVGNPNWEILPKVLKGLKESLQIAAVGTVMAAILAIPFGALAARNLSRLPVLPAIGKFLLNLIRAFPELILAIAFISALGPGAFAGVLAVGIHSIGMMGKLYGERIETVDKGAVEALSATGASPADIFRHAILPEVLPDFLSLTLYRFDLNVRAATVLGLVGAGGIGTLLDLQLKGGNWDAIGVILLGTILTIGLIDYISAKLRAKLA
ncbi:MAG: phosphonate ABC transporter, permease protein PhnE [Armatimonadaceae bacterium]